jgi:hypothetical protein
VSKKPLTMSVARPSRAAPPPKEEGALPAVVGVEPTVEIAIPAVLAAPAPPPLPAPVPRLRVGNTARLEQGIKRIVVDVTPSVHKQVKVKAIDYPGGIKEYILRLLEADGLDLSSQPDFVPRPK